MKTLIIAGGKGTRLKDVAGDLPKAMVPVPDSGKPLLEHQLELAKRYGLKEIILLTGHLGEQIKAYFGSGAKWGVNITYHQETRPLGTAGCIKEIENLLTEDFFVFYGDTLMDIALDKMLAFHKQNKAAGTLFLHPNDHPYDSDLVDINENNEIIRFYPKPHANGNYRNLVNAALYILSPAILKHIERGVSADFGKTVFPQALAQKVPLYGYISPEYIKDLGTPDRYRKVTKDFLSGKIARLNLNHKRPAIFLDRDGVLNREVDLICRTEQLELLPGTAEAVRKINQSEYLAVVVTNQTVIARNLCDFAELRDIHNRLETLLGNEHAYVDAIYFCPHHPDSGYPEERRELKIDCACRKPKPGMLLQAARELNIDLPNSWLIGDRTSDILAGKNAGVKTLLVKSNQTAYLNEDAPADWRESSLLSAVSRIIRQ